MKLGLLGSCIVQDVANLLKGKIKISNHFRSVSLGGLKTDVGYNERLVKYLKNNGFLANSEIQFAPQSLNLKDDDYFLIDLLDFRIPYVEVVLSDGSKLHFTRTKEIAENEEKIKRECDFIKEWHNFFPLQFSESELESAIKDFADFCNCYLPEIILLEVAYPYQYISLSSEIKNYDNVSTIINGNYFFEKVYKLFKKYCTKCYIIEKPYKFLFGNQNCKSPFLFHFNKPFYEYYSGCVDDILFSQKEKTEERLKRYFKESQSEILYARASMLATNVKAIASSRRLFLYIKQGKEEEAKIFCDILLQKYGIKIENVVGFGCWSGIVPLSEHKGTYKNKFFVVPHLIDKEIISDFFSNEIGLANIIPMSCQKLVISNFTGIYYDLFGNEIKAGEKVKLSVVLSSVNNKIFFEGSQIKACNTEILVVGIGGTQCSVGKDAEFLKCVIHISTCGKIIIGENTLVVEARIFSHELNEIIIGKDCMISTEVFFYCGDGHSIYDIEQRKNINLDYFNNNFRGSKIVLGEHVWIAMRTTLLGGAEIGSGSVIGACSVVKKKVPNNVVAVGNTLKVVRKNIAWSRISYGIINDIDACVPQIYQKYTEELE